VGVLFIFAEGRKIEATSANEVGLFSIKGSLRRPSTLIKALGCSRPERSRQGCSRCSGRSRLKLRTCIYILTSGSEKFEYATRNLNTDMLTKLIQYTLMFLLLPIASAYSQGINANLNELVSPREPLDIIGHYRVYTEYNKVTEKDQGSFVATGSANFIDSFLYKYEGIFVDPQDVSKGVRGGFMRYLMSIRTHGALVFSCNKGLRMNIVNDSDDINVILNDVKIVLHEKGDESEKYVFDASTSTAWAMDIVASWSSGSNKTIEFDVIYPKNRSKSINSVIGMEKWVKIEVYKNSSNQVLERDYSLKRVEEAIRALPCYPE